jgi:transcriptional regulator with XRE-family HTH domain
MEKIGRRLCGIRNRFGYTQERVVLELNIPQKSYSELERGMKMLTLDKVMQLAKLYKIDFWDFMKEILSEETINIHQSAENQQAITHSSQITINNHQVTREEFDSLRSRIDTVFEAMVKLLQQRI